MFDMLETTFGRLTGKEATLPTRRIPHGEDVIPKAEKIRARLERRAGMTLFTWGSGLCGTFLVVAAVIGTGLVMAGVDPRPYAAILPLLYAPMLLGGVGWLVWISDPARTRGRQQAGTTGVKADSPARRQTAIAW